MELLEILSRFYGSIVYMLLGVASAGGFPRKLSSAEENVCLTKMREGDRAARDKLIEHNLRLVAYINRKYYSSANDPDDLISIGTIGLIKAVDSFSLDKGIRFSSYASRCIENEVLMYLRSVKKHAQDISISDSVETDRQGNSITFMDVIADDEVLEDATHRKIQSRQLLDCVRRLEDDREKEIIIRRYGLFGNRRQTQNEIADSMGISRSYVSRIEKKAVERLRDMMDGR